MNLENINCENPNWKPLEDLNRYYPELFNMDDFMWMHTIKGIECYKHRLLRSYINIDSNGDFWKYTNLQGAGSGGAYGYEQIPILAAVKELNKMNEYQQQFDARHRV